MTTAKQIEPPTPDSSEHEAQLIRRALEIFQTADCIGPESPGDLVELKKITSSGQTGAARAALDVAIKYGFPHGGWCPKGRKSEDGPIDRQYHLIETPSRNYLQRTDWNVRDSDGTVIFTAEKNVTGRLLRVTESASENDKPFIHISFLANENPHFAIKRFVTEHRIRVLNVAGSRASKESDIWAKVYSFLEKTFFGEFANKPVNPPSAL